MGKYEILHVSLPEEITLAGLDEKAKELGLGNRSQFILEAARLLIGFDVVFWLRMVKFSKSLHIPVWMVIQNFIIKRLARDAAEIVVHDPKTMFMDEFTFLKKENGDVRTLTGEELFNFFKEKYVKEMMDEKIRFLLEKERVFKLTDEEKKFMIENQVGDAYGESDEYKERLQKKSIFEQLEKEDDIEDDVAEWTPDVDPDKK